jgi:predicted  nucleic acid-binding Zn-ribbon protein
VVPKLKFQDPTGKEMTVEISEAFPEITIGRNPGNVIRINNPSISRSHAKILFEGGRCTIFDLNSSNGSFVNGKKVRSQVLNHGDRVRCGGFPLEFADGDADLNVGEGSGVVNAAPPPFSAPPPPIGSPPAPGALESVPPPGMPPAMEHSFEQEEDHSSGAWAQEVGHESASSGIGFSVDPPADAPSSPLVVPYEEEEEDEGLFLPEDDDDDIVPQPPSTPSEVELLQAELESVRRSKIEAEARAAEVESQLRSGNAGELEELCREREQLAQELDQIRSAGADGASNLQIEKLRKDRERLHEERRNLMRQISDLKRSLEDAPDPDEVAQLRVDLATAQSDRETLTSTREELENAVTERDVSLEEAHAEITNAAEEKAVLEGQIEELVAERDGLVSERDVLTEDLGGAPTHQEVVDLKEEIARLNGDLSETAQARDELASELDDISASFGESQTNLTAVQTDLEKSNQLRERYQSEREEFRQARDAFYRENESLKKELEGARSSSGIVPVSGGDDLSKLETENDELRAKLSKNRAIFEDLAADLRGLVSEKSRLEKENASLREKADGDNGDGEELGGRLAEAESQRDDFAIKIAELEEDRDRMSSIISQLQDAPMPDEEVGQLRAELEESEVERERLEKRLQSVGVYSIDE